MPTSNKELAWLDCGIFPVVVMFSCGFSYDEVVKLLKKKKAEHWLIGLGEDKDLVDKSNYLAMRRDIEYKKTGEKKTMFYIFIGQLFKFTDYEMAKLAHEVLHICQYSLPDILDRNKEHEAEAYLHTHLMRQCLKILRKK